MRIVHRFTDDTLHDVPDASDHDPVDRSVAGAKTVSRGIIFTSESVRAILAGTKTQTRRLRGTFATGDRLWVREAWRTEEREEDRVDGIRFKADNVFVPISPTFRAAENWVVAHDNGKHGPAWRPSLFLPRWASRITLEVLAVRVEKLQEITDDDARAEGAVPRSCGLDTGSFRSAFLTGWDTIHGKKAPWSSNPEVRVITFRRSA